MFRYLVEAIDVEAYKPQTMFGNMALSIFLDRTMNEFKEMELMYHDDEILNDSPYFAKQLLRSVR